MKVVKATLWEELPAKNHIPQINKVFSGTLRNGVACITASV